MQMTKLCLSNNGLKNADFCRLILSFNLSSFWQLLSLIKIVGYCLLSLIFFKSNTQMLLFLQGEMQQLRDKLAITERAAKSEAQLKVIM